MAQESVCSRLPLKRTTHSAGEAGRAAECSEASGRAGHGAAGGGGGGDLQHPSHQPAGILPFLQKGGKSIWDSRNPL